MKVTPVRHYSDPSFPTRSILDERPELLRLVPKRWQRNPAVLTALAGMCVMIAGCGKNQATSVARVAPIFEHGDGRGSMGCVAVNPPVFLSESEAQQVITDEAKRAGISLSGVTKDQLVILGPATSTEFRSNIGSQYIELVPDGVDAKRKISFEYISRADFDSWKRTPILSWLSGRSSASSCNILGAARVLRTGLSEAKLSGNYAVFYDPCNGRQDVEKKLGQKSYMSLDRMHVSAKALDISREDLRAQVRDFIKWLKAEGVI